MQFVANHWKDIILFVLGVDVLLIPIFPSVPIFEKIKNWLTPIVQK